MDIERTVKTSADNTVNLSNWDDGGIWLGISHRYARMHTTLTRDEAFDLLNGLKIALGYCPNCEAEDWAAVTWSPSQGVPPYPDYAECACGHQWALKG